MNDIEMPKRLDMTLDRLNTDFPYFFNAVRNRVVCDFGCGDGTDAINMAAAGAQEVVGLDSSVKWLSQAKAKTPDWLSNVSFVNEIFPTMYNRFDVILSKDSFEHFTKPKEVLEVMMSLLKPGGRIYITFGPPWYAPYGAHMNYFTKIPWVHLLLPEWLMMSWRSKYRKDGAKKYKEVESGLALMSLHKFEKLVKDSGLSVNYSSYQCVKRLDFLSKVPILRELFTNQVVVILTKEKHL